MFFNLASRNDYEHENDGCFLLLMVLQACLWMMKVSDKTFDPQTAFARFRRVFSASFSFYGWFAGYFSRANSRRLR